MQCSFSNCLQDHNKMVSASETHACGENRRYLSIHVWYVYILQMHFLLYLCMIIGHGRNAEA